MTRKRKIIKHIALFMVVLMAAEFIAPAAAYALTSGPSQPEVQGFQQAGVNDMVDPFTGDFSYNLPLLELPGPNGGYPFNLSYQSGITMDQEASWVGLGWSLSPGQITRQVRGLPDDFNGDEVIVKQDMKPNITVGANIGLAFEFFGADGQLGFNVALGGGVLHNTYSGLGVSSDLGLTLTKIGGGANTLGLGANLSLDSDDGIGLSPEVSFSKKYSESTSTFSVGAGFNSRRGITDITLGISGTKGFDKGEDDKFARYGSRGGSSTLSFANTAFTPDLNLPLINSSVSFKVKIGPSGGGVFSGGDITAHYASSILLDAGKDKNIPAYGYLHYQKATEDALQDINRDKDGPIYKQSRYLANPSLTYDIYSIKGQGVGGMFRPFRNDIGVIGNRKVSSITHGSSGNLDIGIPTSGAPHLGGGFTTSGGVSQSGIWDENNDALNEAGYGFRDKQYPAYPADFEPYYFKTFGENTTQDLTALNHISGEKAVAIGLKGIKSEASASDKLCHDCFTKYKDGYDLNQQVQENPNQSRKPRTQTIQEVTMRDLGENAEAFGEFQIDYYPAVIATHTEANKRNFDREGSPDHQVEGFIVTQPDGTRYVYALPAMNLVQTEVQFSVAAPGVDCDQALSDLPLNPDGTLNHKATFTDGFLSKKTLPAYAHSWMLTSVLGSDFVDADGTPGPSDGDLGYWVKFTYGQANSDSPNPYKWRAPYFGANLSKGSLSEFSDDKGSYMYGEKEVWHLATAETKTHIADFKVTSDRTDARGVSKELQTETDMLGTQAYRLKSIALFSKFEMDSPIKEVHFNHSQTLCKNAPNNTYPTNGKLTLDEVYFTHEINSRGALNKYTFAYEGANPDYNQFGNDRWGAYKTFTDACQYSNFPYVDQNMSEIEKQERAGAWNLTRIETPMGGTIQVEYENDEYGYVQHKHAMEMFQIHSFGDATTPNRIFDPSVSWNPVSQKWVPTAAEVDDNRTVIIDLPDLPYSTLPSKRLERYFEDIDQLLIKTKIKLKQPDNNNVEEFVTAYLDIDPLVLPEMIGPSPSSGGSLVKILLAQPAEEKWEDFPPLALVGWHYLRTNLPNKVAEVNMSGGELTPGSTEAEIKERASTLAVIANEIAKTFTGFHRYAAKKGFSSIVDLENSWIRLNSEKKTKIGGGNRVHKITIKDNWDVLAGSSFPLEVGMVYDYTMEEDGRTISSGVAQYEPFLGGDENPFRHAEKFLNGMPLKSKNALFFELPVNESYYPGAQVGYSKVTITTLATEQVLTNILTEEVPTTGATVQEFYTSRDFPVITDHTDAVTKPANIPIPLPLVGQLSFRRMTASQGYAIVNNDMHGKQKKVSTYGINEVTGEIQEDPISYVEYLYNTLPGKELGTFQVDNRVKVVNFDIDKIDKSKSDISLKVMGQEQEFFVDMRASNTLHIAAGLAFNSDPIPIYSIPIPTIWPNFSSNHLRTRISVANKIIHKKGILSGMRAWNEGSLVETQYLLFDELTGRPLLTSVTNNFDDPIYSYSYPSRWAYDRMGPAYKNTGITFKADVSPTSTSNIFEASNFSIKGEPLAGAEAEVLVPGDEFSIRIGTDAYKAIYVGVGNSGQLFYSESTLSGNELRFALLRSGRRNHLTTDAQQITALKDPTQDRTLLNCWKDLAFPGEDIDELVGTSAPQEVITPAPCAEAIFAYANVNVLPNLVTPLVHTDPNLPIIETCFPDVKAMGTGSGTTVHSLNITYNVNDRCPFSLLDATGTLINYHDILEVQNLSYYPGSIGNQNICADVYLLGDPVPIKGYLFGPCSLPLDTVTTVDTLYSNELISGTGTPTTLNDTFLYINDVLSASAQTYADAWIQDFTNVRFEQGSAALQLANLKAKHPFASGEQGIWRPKSSYVYVEDREQSDPIHLATDGTFNDVPLFNFSALTLENCASKWRKVNEVTEYSPYSYELENRDILGVYSSALYGYNGKLPVAVAANAEKDEIGFESFEEYLPGATIDPLSTSTGNISIFNDLGFLADVEKAERYDLSYGNSNGAAIPNPIEVGNPPYKLEIRNHGSLFTPSEFYAKETPGVLATNLLPFDQIDLTEPPYFHGYDLASMKYKGRISVIEPALTYTSGPISTGISYTNAKAHSGRNSVQIEGTVALPQNHLRFTPLEKYVLQAWVSRENENVPFYQMDDANFDNRIGVKALWYDINNTLLYTSPLQEPSGHLVEGWQKIEAAFKIPLGGVKMVLQIQSGRIDGDDIPLFLDDIRIQPWKSKMTTYVYGTEDYRLKAQIDDDNFATFYHYDEAGQLFLIQKETIDGIRTLQESRTFLKEGAPSTP